MQIDVVHHKWQKVDRTKVGGKEENMTIYQTVEFGGLVQEVIWCKGDNQSVFSLNYNSNIYVSRDHGNNWKNLLPYVRKSTGRTLGISWNFLGLIQSDIDRDNIIILSDAKNSWATTDCGETWKLIPDTMNLKHFKFHPHIKGYVMAISRKLCENTSRSNCKEHNRLFLSENGGKTWRQIADYVFDYIWGRSAYYSFGIKQNSIFITQQDKKHGNQPEQVNGFGKHSKVSLYYSDDFFKTSKKLLEGGFKMWTSRCCLFVHKPTDEGIELVVSEVWNNRFKFLPVNILGDHDYTRVKVLTEVKSFYTYIYATREVGNDLFVGDLLKADYSSSNFTLMQRNIVVNEQIEQSSFEEIESMMGLSLINTYDEKMVDYILHQGTNRMNKGGGMFEEINKFITTKISFNMGANYQTIHAPIKDMFGDPWPECELCSLHVHTHDDTVFPQVYGHKSAPGILIANGNVGLHLSFEPAMTSTFVSSDGGLSWTEVMKGVHIYELGDQGGLILLAEFGNPTNKVYFSHDYGKSFKFISFSKTKLIVSNIIIEPTNNAHQFFVVASSIEDNKEKGYLVHLDFNEFHSRHCTGHNNPDDEKSDYTKFVPHTYKNKNCLLGRSGYYVRKKATIKCFNPDFYKYIHVNRICECTEQDWECDAGFIKVGGAESTVCQLLNEKSISYDPPSNCKGMYYFISEGYRKVADNICKGGVEHPKRKLSCPGGWGMFGIFMSFIFKLVFYGVVIFVVFVGGKYLYDQYSDSDLIIRMKEGMQQQQGYQGVGISSGGGLLDGEDEDGKEESEEEEDDGGI